MRSYNFVNFPRFSWWVFKIAMGFIYRFVRHETIKFSSVSVGRVAETAFRFWICLPRRDFSVWLTGCWLARLSTFHCVRCLQCCVSSLIEDESQGFIPRVFSVAQFLNLSCAISQWELFFLQAHFCNLSVVYAGIFKPLRSWSHDSKFFRFEFRSNRRFYSLYYGCRNRNFTY